MTPIVTPLLLSHHSCHHSYCHITPVTSLLLSITPTVTPLLLSHHSYCHITPTVTPLLLSHHSYCHTTPIVTPLLQSHHSYCHTTPTVTSFSVTSLLLSHHSYCPILKCWYQCDESHCSICEMWYLQCCGLGISDIVGRTFSLADSDTKKPNGIIHKQMVKNASTWNIQHIYIMYRTHSYGDVPLHWSSVYCIVRTNPMRGQLCLSFSEYITTLWHHKLCTVTSFSQTNLLN